MRERKTYDEWEIQGWYGQGWECLTTEDSNIAARCQLMCYNLNEKGVPHRIKKIRVRKS